MKGRILVVDDNPSNRLAIKIYLDKKGFKILEAENGQIAMDILQREEVDLILLDLIMPRMDGYEVLEKIKKTETLKDLPVVVLTARTDADDVAKALALGANHFLKKPIDLQELEAHCKNFMKHYRLEEEKKYELYLGGRIQKKILFNVPRTEDIFSSLGWSIFVHNESPVTIAGDFFYSCNVNATMVNFCLFDMCGHGIPAALLSLMAMNIIANINPPTDADASPVYFLQKIHEGIRGILPDGNYLAAGSFLFSNSEVYFSSADLPCPIVISRDGAKEIAIENTLPLGTNSPLNLTEQKIPLPADGRLFLYTDGLTEALNPQQRIYGSEQLLNILTENKNLASNELIGKVTEAVKEFCGGHLQDDLTIIIFERKE